MDFRKFHKDDELKIKPLKSRVFVLICGAQSDNDGKREQLTKNPSFEFTQPYVSGELLYCFCNVEFGGASWYGQVARSKHH